MDPRANLASQRSEVSSINAIWDACPEDGNPTADQLDQMYQHAIRLAELVEALDGWISKGGFSPWNRNLRTRASANNREVSS
jgi:hypothetical protein